MRRGFLLLCSVAAAVTAGPIYAGLGMGCGRAALETNLFLDAAPDITDEPAVEAGPPPIETSRKLDLLLVVDNSQNTDVAHQVLVDTIPYLTERLIHPPCVNGLGNVVATPPTEDAPCPVGERDFRPLTDIHIGVISTSIGGHGADICSPANVSYKPEQNDAAHLLARIEGGGAVPTYMSKGFLFWDPLQGSNPPGDADQAALTAKIQQMAKGTGTSGCGFESQLESIYRFLIDPDPYLSIGIVNGKATPSGTDTIVLQQRGDFVRPDSALVILLITDEDDCSTREGGQFFLANQGTDPATGKGSFRMPRARSECAQDPNDPCCASCSQPTPAGCSPTPSSPNCQLPPPTSIDDPINLRCFDQKRRFGIDFLYPIERYVKGLSDPMITDRQGNLVPNPLFTGNRSPNLVIFGGVIGVPWQDIAKDPTAIATGFAPPSEIDWDLVIGDPTMNVPPADPLMIGSIDPRTGTNPPSKTALAPPSAPSALANPINGHERTIPDRDDLQYVCIYPRQAPKDCAGGACECDGKNIATNPICQQPDGTYSSVQRYARALPATRALRLIQGLGDRAAVGSVCPTNVVDPSAPTSLYKPSIDAVLRQVRLRIQ